MKKYYIHKVENGFTIRCEGQPLDSKGNPNQDSPKVYKDEKDCRKALLEFKNPSKGDSKKSRTKKS